MEEKLNKNLLLIFRIVCALAGAAVGVVAIWQVFQAKPNLVQSAGLKAVFYIACGALPAVVLLLSARPLLGLVLSVCERVKRRFRGVKAVEVAGVFLGLIIGVFFGFVSEVVMELFLRIVALRILIAVVIAVVTAYFSAVLCLKFIGKAEDADRKADDADSERKEYTGAGGYVLTGSALKSDRIVNVCENWLNCDVFVLSSTVNFFAETEETNSVSAEAVKRFNSLKESGKVKVVEFDFDAENEDDRIISFAWRENLKILVLNGNSVKETRLPVHLLALDEL